MFIESPGKFQGEARWVPYMWEQSLDGDYRFAEDDESIIVVDVMPHDQARFPELREFAYVEMVETDDGFVYGKGVRREAVAA